jgi:hypothetical protein
MRTLVIEKLRAAWVRPAPSGSFDSAPQRLWQAINLWGASLRMTIFVGDWKVWELGLVGGWTENIK